MTSISSHVGQPDIWERRNAILVLAADLELVNSDTSTLNVMSVLLKGLVHPGWDSVAAHSRLAELAAAIVAEREATAAIGEHPDGLDRSRIAQTLTQAIAWSLVFPPEPDRHRAAVGAVPVEAST
ncbi:hypothetical protein [Frankia sp. Cj3]|uniref:hypothetical protein n=1 Tax=Frankia sp. Cj3 TaxID=2880976 RepID=UPI001EF735E0|nr:hypothetical protein [Frankia sp. Cj3]